MDHQYLLDKIVASEKSPLQMYLARLEEENQEGGLTEMARWRCSG